ncbi:hypothetical protein [Humisphaera borealis]|uniref:Uncharacterized protein n=1 Tax=Humisphaera borealis TaxID=2807512 RepID=A0A7M2X1X3_9BACT|nr:hypothetical protein [Humisphaera borealis]QOV91757.1 hypothetical protein IPV69_10540 [Humisphaera borealis]
MSTWLRLTLITMTVGGGFTGVALTAQFLFSPQITGPAVLAICIVFLLLHGFVLASGLLFLHNPEILKPMVVALAIQIPYVSSPLVTYRFGCGLLGGFGIAETGPFGWLRLGSDWQFYLFQPLRWGFGINLVAVGMLAAISMSIARHRRRSVAAASSDSAWGQLS